MNNLLRILMVAAVITGVFPIMVSAADPIADADVAISFIIDDGNPADLHDENGWLVAGNGISSTIHVDYTGSMSPDIHYVRFTSVEKDTYGDVSKGYVAAAPYETVFSASENAAGNAPILVQINYTADGVGYDYYRTVYQPIDHNAPMKIRDLAFESEVSLGEATDIIMTMEDVYGNAITSLYEDATGGTPEYATFSTTSHSRSGLYNGTSYDAESVTIPVSADGLVSATFKVGTEAGPMYLIHLMPGMGLDDKWLTITALADGEPNTIVVSVVPNFATPPCLPADGESRFYLIYHLFDRYGNPSGNQALSFSDDVTGDVFTRWTDSDGDVKISFGPFDSAATYTIHAEAVANPFVSVDQKLRFISTAPEGMYLTANPQSMPSADVAPEMNAQILVKVTDESGNGVPGETVRFFIIPPGLWHDAHLSDPYLDDTIGVADATVTTNEGGIAMVNFTPGAFACSGDETYSATASESCDVLAMWDTKSQTIALTWRNYPYLRVETEVSPSIVEVGDTVDATIRLTGDGWGLYPAPIDVMLCADRSGSMLEDNPDRMVSAMDAMNAFNGKMAKGTDRVGLASFGAKGCADIYDYWAYYWPGDDSKENYTYYVLDESEYGHGHHGQSYGYGYGYGYTYGYGYGYNYSYGYGPGYGPGYEYDACYNSSEDTAYINAHYPGNGKSYADYATLDSGLTEEIDTVTRMVGQLVPMDGTPMRHGLYLAITELIENGDSDAVQAVILLSDGDYNTGGDPLARGLLFSDGNRYRHRNGNCNGNCYGWSCGSEYPYDYYYYDDLSPEQQNLSVYANDHDIAIYSIAFGDGLTEDGIDTLETLAASTGGLYYHAPTGDNLTAIYLAIAGELRIEAGVNTTMDLMFTDIELNNVTQVNGPDNRILEYTYAENLSTLIKSWRTALSPHWSEDSDNVVRPLTLIDQTGDWVDDNQKLTFDAAEIGTIHLGQVWQTKFRLNVSKPGNINIFGAGSLVTFNNGEETLPLPKTYVTAVMNATGLNFTGLQVSDLVCVEALNGDVISNYLTLEWNLSYSGTNTVTQYLYYQNVDDGIWTTFNELTVPGPVADSLQAGQLYVADFPPGEYKIRVRATADDAPDSVSETTDAIVIGQGGHYFIRIG
ncbi:hypothetical protein L1S32_06845 [Methanogenium sp. S4BF]|uniref:hypothetical protein n=1 Tax=Methanogenium sp. S4BF TaxID=1789226 RepID=UPI002417F658|nr:hypothetical protein [Methanogenium sp. S4BF]WFN33572.1 hypothetical protein L1S32_06845 [Methanogenium sp. S4BF]